MINDEIQSQINKILKTIKEEHIQKIVVGAVIFLKPKSVLLLKRKSNDFMGGLIELPSGTVEKDEFLIDGLIREIKEETNLEIKSIDKFIGTFDYFSSSGKKTRQVNFVVSVTNNDIKLSDEHEAFYILSKDSEEFKTLNISSKTKEIIEKSY